MLLYSFDEFDYLKRLGDICSQLYPDDSTYEGKELRLKQQYFFSAAGVKAICKRTVFKTKSKHVFQLASYTFDGVRHVLIRNGVEKKLTNRELDLLFLFCEYKNRVVERSFALQRIWHEENYFSARNMDVYITKIRKLFKDDPNVELQNIHGVGYKLVVKE